MNIAQLPADITPVEVVDALVELYGQDLRYSIGAQKWLVFDETTGWTWDHQGARVQEVVIATLRHLEQDIPDDLDVTKRRRFSKMRRSRARQMMSAGGLNGVISLATKRAVLACPDTLIDAQPHLIGTTTGIVDLRTGRLQGFSRELIIARRVPVTYEANAQCPRWERFLTEVIGDGPGVQKYFQELLGYTLTGDTQEQKMWLFVGGGSNGKSSLLRSMQNTLGSDYAQQAPEAVLFGRPSTGGTTGEIARLKGVRCAVLTETDYGQAFNETRVKSLVAGDKITARALYQDFDTFVPQAKYFLATNHLPTVRGADRGIWRRLVVVPFTSEFEVGSDTTLNEDLDAELAGIFAWAVNGAIRWYKQRKLSAVPESWNRATETYRAEQDLVKAFIDECAVLDPVGNVGATDLHVKFVTWCEAEGRQSLNQSEFGRRMMSTGLVTRDRKGKANRYHYFGVALRSAAGEAELGGLVDQAFESHLATPPCLSLLPPDSPLLEVNA